MKKLVTTMTLGTIILAACSNSSVDVENAAENNEQNENIQTVPREDVQDSVTKSTSEEYYQSVLPYELSPARGLTSSNMVSTYNMEAFEKGLFELSKGVFSTDEYVFREGQIMSEEMTREYLKRQYSEEQIEEMDEDELKKTGAFSNLGLNPSSNGENDPENLAKNAPIYLSHILEQDYLKVDEEGNQSFEGITFGLAMNSEYLYQKEQYGTTYEEELDLEEVKKQGEEMAREMLERLRANSDYADKKVMFAVFIQSKGTDIIPGNFVSYAVVDPGEEKIDKFETIDEKNVLLPSNDKAVPEEINNEYRAFNRELEGYFKSFTTSVGRGVMRDGKLEELSIEIPFEYESRGEMIGISQFVHELVEKHFGNTKVTVKIQDKSKVYATITSNGEDDVQLYIME